MFKILRKSITLALSIITIIFTFVPETFFEKYKLLSNASDEVNVILTHFLTFIAILVLSIILNLLYLFYRKSVCIKGHNYNIKIEYGNLLEMGNCKKIINFDECFTTSIGDAPADIKLTSLCGQYLVKKPIKDIDIQCLIDKVQLKTAKSRSKYQNKVRYESGKLVPNDDYLLMAFAKLDKDGVGHFSSRDEFLDCLSLLWKEIDKYYGQKDVCIPILGSGLTRIGDTSPTQQELLDMIILSYRLSPHKIKSPCQLHIVCQKCNGFSINKIGENI